MRQCYSLQNFNRLFIIPLSQSLLETNIYYFDQPTVRHFFDRNKAVSPNLQKTFLKNCRDNRNFYFFGSAVMIHILSEFE